MKKEKESVFKEAKEFCDAMERLGRAEQKALALVQQCEKKLADARRARAQEMATALESIGDGDLPTQQPLAEESALNDARAALAGVRRRIRDLDVQVLTLRERVAAERVEHNAKVGSDFLRSEFRPAAAAFAQVLRRAHALADALGITLDPRGSDDTIHEAARLPGGPDWSTDKSARALHEGHCDPRNIAVALNLHAREAEVRVLEQERISRSRPPFDAGAKFQVVRVFRAAGRDYQAEQIIDSFQVDVALLAKLHHARYIRVVPNEELA